MGPVTVGIDVGQKRDPTAIAVAEVEWRTDDASGRREDYHLIRYLERLPLGTAYPDVAIRLGAIVSGLRSRGARPAVYVDATGVGQPVVDILRRAGVTLTAVYFTHGDRRVEHEDGYVTLGKAWLVSRLQALLQTGRILLPATDEARVLAKELQDFEIHIDRDANDTYGAFAVGSHDDLVTALGLATQGKPARTPAPGVLLQGAARMGAAHAPGGRHDRRRDTVPAWRPRSLGQ